MYQMAKKARNNCLEIRCLGSKLFIALIRRRITVKCVISRALFNIKIVACVFFGPLLSIVPISVFDISLLKASADVQFVCLDALLFFFLWYEMVDMSIFKWTLSIWPVDRNHRIKLQTHFVTWIRCHSYQIHWIRISAIFFDRGDRKEATNNDQSIY